VSLTRPRSSPGADGIAMMTFIRLGVVEDLRQIARRPPHPHALEAQPLLERVVIDVAERMKPEIGVARSSWQTRRPPWPAPTISTVRRPRAPARKAGQAAVVDSAGEHPRAAQERQRQQEVNGRSR